MNTDLPFLFFWNPERSLLDVDTILDITKNVKTYKKGDLIVSAGTIYENFFLIDKGLVKQCQSINGKESILNFFHEGSCCTILESFQKKTPATSYIVAIEETELFSISFDEITKLRAKSKKFNQLFNDIFIWGSAVIVSRLKSMYEKDKIKAYEDFLKQNKQIVQRISLGDVANYLGITLVHLSRIRGNYKKH